MTIFRTITVFVFFLLFIGFLLFVTKKYFLSPIIQRVIDQQKKVTFVLRHSYDENTILDEIKNSETEEENGLLSDCFADLKSGCITLPVIYYTDSNEPMIAFKSTIFKKNSEENLKSIRSLLYGDLLFLPQLEGIDTKNKDSKEIGLDVLIQNSLQYDINPIYVSSIVRYMSPINYAYFTRVTDFIARKTRQYYLYFDKKWINEWWYGKLDSEEKVVLKTLAKEKNKSTIRKILTGLGLLYFKSDFSHTLYKPMSVLLSAQTLQKTYSLTFSTQVFDDTKDNRQNLTKEMENALTLGVCRGGTYYWCIEDVEDRESPRLLCREIRAFPQVCKRTQKMLEL